MKNLLDDGGILDLSTCKFDFLDKLNRTIKTHQTYDELGGVVYCEVKYP